MRYSYTIVSDPLLPGKKAYLPLLDINIGEYKTPIKGLLDTGSPVTIIHSALGVAGGIIPSSGRKSTLLGVGGEVLSGYYLQVPFFVASNSYEPEIFLTADLHLPYCLLGQIGFFQYFIVSFALSKKQFDVIPSFQ